MIRRWLDRLLGAIARLATKASFRSVEIVGFDAIPRHRPILLVANHFNGLVDPVVLIAAYRRVPRFMAKATLWKVVVARPFLALAGLIPVHRAVDGPAGATNQGAFAAAEAAFRAGDTVAVFPEGTTHDRPRLAELRTGAARVALGAHARGVRGLLILPVGLFYEDKVALRSRVLVHTGEPLDLDALAPGLVASAGELSDANHEAVRALTAELSDRLRAVSPDFDTVMEATALSLAADVRLRQELDKPQQTVPLAPREQLAARLGARSEPERDHLVGELARYQLALDVVGVSDAEVMPPATPRTLVTRLIVFGLLVLVLAPFALAGVIVNAVPTLVVGVAGLTVAAPVTKGTVRLLVGLVVFPLTWIVVAWFDVGNAAITAVLAALTFPLTPLIESVWGGRGGFWPSLLVFVTAPLFGLAAILLAERALAWLRLWRGWHALVARRGQLADVLDLRQRLVADVDGVGTTQVAFDASATSDPSAPPRRTAAGRGG